MEARGEARACAGQFRVHHPIHCAFRLPYPHNGHRRPYRHRGAHRVRAAADGTQHLHRPHHHRSRHHRSGTRHGLHRPPAAVPHRAAAGRPRHHERHPQHGHHDHRAGRHRHVHRRRRLGRGHLPRHHDVQPGHDPGGQRADRAAGHRGGPAAGPGRGVHATSPGAFERTAVEALGRTSGFTPQAGPGRRRGRSRGADSGRGVRVREPRRWRGRGEHRHEAHDRAVHPRRDAEHADRARHRPQGGADAGRGRRHVEHRARHGEGRLRPLPRVHGNGMERRAQARRHLRRVDVRHDAAGVRVAARPYLGGHVRLQQHVRPGREPRRGRALQPAHVF